MRILTLIACLCVSGAALAEDVSALTVETREKAMPVLPEVKALLKRTAAETGLVGAVSVCKKKAPELMRQRGEALGWDIRRVSLKTRNPERGTPDAWEAEHLKAFDTRAAAGEKASALEVGEVVSEADGTRMFRYMRAIPVGEGCLACHGDPAQIDPALKAEIDASYPQDQATGYSLGQIRGALTVKRPL